MANQSNHLKAFRKLNDKCLELEVKLKRELLDINKALLAKVKKRDGFLHDYFVTVECRFLLGESSPDFKLDGDNLVAPIKFHGTFFPPYHQDNPWHNLASDKDFNAFKSDNFYPLRNEHHCYLLSLVQKSIDPSSIEKIYQIETITSDIIVHLQHVTELKGKPFKSERLSFPDIDTAKLIKGKKK